MAKSSRTSDKKSYRPTSKSRKPMHGFISCTSVILSHRTRSASCTQRTCRRRVIASADDDVNDESIPRSTQQRLQAEENDKRNGSSHEYQSQVDKIAKSLADVRYRYERISDEVRTLHELPDDYILGADLSNFYIGSTSTVQDLPLPDSPAFHGLSPRDVLSIAEDFLRRKGVPNEFRSSMIRGLNNVLICLRNWVSDIGEEAKALVVREEDMIDTNLDISMTAFVHLVQLARFSIMPVLPTINDPPSPELIPLGSSKEETLDASIITNYDVLRKTVMDQNCDLRKESFYPYVFVATRGASVMRNSGLLLSLKFRAIERSYLGWLVVPFSVFLKPRRTLKWIKSWLPGSKLDMKKSNLDETDFDGDTDKRNSEKLMSRAVRRIVPAVRLISLTDAIRSLFFPSFTQEPCHELFILMYREVEQDKNVMQKVKRAALLKQIKESISQALDPFATMKAKVEQTNFGIVADPRLEDFANSDRKTKPISLHLYKDIPWGLTEHYFPSIYVLPATRDLLRLDAVTIFGLISAVITYFRHSGNWFSSAFLFGSLISYVVRVASGWRKASTRYREKIATDKVANTVAQQWAAIDTLCTLAVEEAFAQLTAVFLASEQENGQSATEVEKEMFKNGSLDGDTSDKWKRWLDEHLHDASRERA